MTRCVILKMMQRVMNVRVKQMEEGVCKMNLFKKTFLFVVGVVTIAFDQVAESVEEALESLETRREKINERFANR